MRIVLDTNIVFSGMLNSSSKIGKILINPNSHFQFYSCEYLTKEIRKHKAKLLKLTKLNEDSLNELEGIITKNITFINEALLPPSLVKSTELLLKNIDINDTPFVALAKHLDAKLWTGYMELYNGLKSKRFKDIITTLKFPVYLMN